MILESSAIRLTPQFELQLLDQTELPKAEKWISILTIDMMIEAIQKLRVRGAPLIGLSASLFLALESFKKDKNELIKVYKSLRASRPTAVNLMNNLDQVWSTYIQFQDPERTLEEAKSIFFEDQKTCEKLAKSSLSLMPEVSGNLITHCNTGALATAGGGTALGAIIYAFRQGRKIHVYVNETRPLGQGARLTFWELKKANVPATLITDSMAGFLMKTTPIHSVWVGADRITQNGDVANKIGTYSLACLAQKHRIPFYVVAPKTTYDSNLFNGNQIEIEMRSSTEITNFWGLDPDQTPTFNPGFDITPNELITQIVWPD